VNKLVKMKLIIDRVKWLRGEGDFESMLYRSTDGKMCCLGFLGEMCGVSKEEMTYKKRCRAISNSRKFNERSRSELDVKNSENPWPGDLCFLEDGEYWDNGIVKELYGVNDASIQYISDSEREDKLTELFGRLGIEVEFIN